VADRAATSIVIVTYESEPVLGACLDSLVAALHPGDEIVVVDNASRDGTTKVARSHPGVRVIANHVNLGFAAAANQGTASVATPYTVLLNPDTVVAIDAVDRLVDVVARHGGQAIAGPRVLNPDGTVQRSAFRFPTPPVLLLEQLGLGTRIGWLNPSGGLGDCEPVDWLKGACLAGATDLLQRYGPFDERFFMFSEDVDLCYRLRAAGIPSLFCQDATISHIGGASTRRHPRRMARLFTDSVYRFYAKHWSTRQLAAAGAVLRATAGLKMLRALTRAAIAAAQGMPAVARRARADARVAGEVLRAPMFRGVIADDSELAPFPRSP
jgi:GT2 family glycosyltransferase